MLTQKKNFTLYFILIVLLLGCPSFFDNEQYTVKYQANGAIVGTEPFDAKYYSSGESAVVLSDNDLFKEDYFFAGWNTKSDGTGESYQEGDEIIIESKDIDLYAKWLPVIYTSDGLTFKHDPYDHYFLFDGYEIIECDKNLYGSISIPSEIHGFPVVSIGSHAFEECSNITDIIMPDTITNISGWAFESCQSLKSITISNSVTAFDFFAFSNCINLESLVIPSSVNFIAPYAFLNCVKLIEVIIPDSVTSIRGQAFEGCTGLTRIIIPDSISVLETQLFKDCSNLSTIELPNTITKIDYCVFENCSSLVSISIPENVELIERNIFQGCSSLETLNMYALSAPELDYRGVDEVSEFFYDISNVKLHLKSGAVGYDTEPWTDSSIFSEIIYDL